VPKDVPDPLSTPRLERWLAATTTPLDFLALATIWLTILPFTRATDTSSLTFWVVGRLMLSLVYGIDMGIRCHLSTNGRRYFLKHPVGVAAVIVPPVRILFSLRLLGSMFRKGNLGHFLFVALMLVLNGVVLVYFFEVDAPGANIVTLGDSLWWAAVTVATVGYGDYYPVTMGGRLTAVALMGIGLVTAAVVTAQVASTFMDQATARRAALAQAAGGAVPAEVVAPVEPAPVEPEPEPDGAGVRALHERLDRIEALLRDRNSA
jgi:voltage-gated potassium channel